MELIRETSPGKNTGYRVYKFNESIVIEAKERGVLHKRKSLYLKRRWDAGVWRELQRYSDSAFNGACCLELGIGAFTK